ncbi:hypothetical protein BCR34DRAFT_607854 [Clohesyomyces aquaticus]|uniref:Uncharacterized protein n=1 Tax=Clohesyomyces aquaticus TaxID=1231657 RepID=A0A1Y1YCP0_9PLEO|nr:hypothetical protein BCR34DRAFT_607854 [Clohesyomyces aquaticus]
MTDGPPPPGLSRPPELSKLSALELHNIQYTAPVPDSASHWRSGPVNGCYWFGNGNHAGAISEDSVPENWRPHLPSRRPFITLLMGLFVGAMLGIFVVTWCKCWWNGECCWQLSREEEKERKRERKRKRRQTEYYEV